jgi:hypothetical protein
MQGGFCFKDNCWLDQEHVYKKEIERSHNIKKECREAGSVEQR